MKNGREERKNFIYISWQNKQKNKTNEIEYKMILVLLRGKFASFFRRSGLKGDFLLTKCVRNVFLYYLQQQQRSTTPFETISLEFGRKTEKAFPKLFQDKVFLAKAFVMSKLFNLLQLVCFQQKCLKINAFCRFSRRFIRNNILRLKFNN